MYNLRDLFLNALGMELAEETIGNDREVSGIADNSRTVLKDEVFCCIAGDKFDGHDFAQQAQKEGASCLVVERELKIEGILQIKVNDTRRACARLAAEFYGNPSASLRIIGITGTNGKTTTAGLLAHLLGERTSVIGTLTSSLTTPGAVELQRKLAELLAVGTDSVVLEVSSHALHQYRVEGIKFDLAIFLNLGKDHLDYHANEEEYFCAKARLFDSELSKRALINTDTEWGNRLLKGDFGDKKPFLSLTESVGFSTKDIEVLKSEISGSEFLWRGRHCRINIPGKVNVANAAAALEAAALLGISPDESVERLKTSPTTKGRFEIVELNPFFVVVDFAHTPDALAAVLKSARELIKKGSLKVVFGCGGERDRKKTSRYGSHSRTLCR